MRFYKCIKSISSVKVGDIVVDSFIHYYRTVILATHSEKRRILRWNRPQIANNYEYFEPLSMQELDKLKPHISKTLIIDYNLSFNDYYLNQIYGSFCCNDCGVKLFKTQQCLMIENTIGECEVCGEKNKKLHHKTRFRREYWEDIK